MNDYKEKLELLCFDYFKKSKNVYADYLECVDQLNDKVLVKEILVYFINELKFPSQSDIRKMYFQKVKTENIENCPMCAGLRFIVYLLNGKETAYPCQRCKPHQKYFSHLKTTEDAGSMGLELAEWQRNELNQLKLEKIK